MRPRTSTWVAGVGCLLAGGCGERSLPPAGAAFIDGSRLKAIWEQAPGGPKRQVGWYDTALGTPCVFQYPTASGAIHALTEKQVCSPWPSTSVTLGDSA